MASIIEQLASSSGEKSQDLNIMLAQEIAAGKDTKAIQELIAGLQHKTKAIRHDCIKTLYETAAVNAMLLAPHTDTFIALLDDKDNRMQWGAMTALSAMATVAQPKLFKALSKIIATAESGSVITRDHCVRILAALSADKKYAETTIPLLLEQILQSPPNQVPSYAEQALPVVGNTFKSQFEKALHTRLNDIEQDSKRKRIEKVLKKLK